MAIDIPAANQNHTTYATKIVSMIEDAAQKRGTGIAKRKPEYIVQKIEEGKAIIALDGAFIVAGFCYIESWGHDKYVANSGLIVHEEYRGQGLSKKIKQKAFELSREKFQQQNFWTNHFASCNEN